MSDKEIKQLSKRCLKNRRLKAILIFVFSVIAIAFFAITPYVFKLIADFSGARSFFDPISPYIFPTVSVVILTIVTVWALCIYSSSSLGEKAWYSGRLCKKQNCEKRLYFWFKPKYSFKALKFSLAMLSVKLFWSIIMLSPAILILTSVVYLAYSGGIEFYLFASLTAGGAVLALAGLIFRFVFLQRYFLAPYLIASNPKLGAIQAIKQSKNLLDGHIFRIVRFKLSFIPQFLSYLFIIPFFFFHPHYKQSCSVIAKTVCL